MTQRLLKSLDVITAYTTEPNGKAPLDKLKRSVWCLSNTQGIFQLLEIY